MSTTSTQNTLKSVLRWIIVIPCSLVAYIAVQFIVAYGNSLMPLPGVIIDTFCQFANSIAGPVALIHVAVTIAPSHKFHVSIVMAALFVSASVVIAIVISINDGFSLSLIWVWVCLLVGILAASAYCLVYHDHTIRQKIPTSETI
jgi:hypothetical protein